MWGITHNSARIQHEKAVMHQPPAALMRCIGNQVTREGRMMKVRLLHLVTVISAAAALSGCVSYGHTHALITPVGVAGYHTFKPDNTAPAVPPRPDPNRMAASSQQQQQDQQQQRGGET